MVQRKQLYLNLVDKLTLIYIVAVGLIIFIFKNNLINYHHYILGHILSVIGLLIFYKLSEKFNLQLLRDWYPLIIVSFLYKETGYLNQIVFKGFWDYFIFNLEQNVFGIDLGLTLFHYFKNIFVNEFMYMSYFSYYLIIPVLGFLIYKKNRKMFHFYLLSIMTTYYICYLLYIFIPIAGPFEFEHLKISGIFFDKIIHFFYKHGELPGSAMPSSHVAIALVVLIYSKITHSFFPIFLVMFICLAISTMYLRYHYFLDVEAGILTGIFCFYLSVYFIKKFKVIDA
jgi:membrane-associated phospholipid phosphatase